MNGNSSQVCPNPLLDSFSRSMVHKLWQVNGLMLVNAVFMGIVVYLGVSAPRAHRYLVIRILALGASTLFLPIVTEVTAAIGTDMYFTSSIHDSQIIAAKCEPGLHVVLILVWTAVVVTIGVNTSIVAVTDAREGRTVEPRIELLFKALWVVYIIIMVTTAKDYQRTIGYIGRLLGNEKTIGVQLAINFSLVIFLPYYKMLSKFLMFHVAKRRVTFGRSTQLIVGYEAQLRVGRNTEQTNGEEIIPKLIVWVHGKYYKIVEQPHGFSLELRQPHRDNNDGEGPRSENKLVTLDRVWEHPNDTFLKQEHKDLCFSFALFKLLRCRFAKYTVSEVGIMEAQLFFRQQYLSGDDHDRVFRVIADELSFISSYYNSFLPIYCTVPIMFLPFTLLSIGYCIYMLIFISRALDHLRGHEQVLCSVWCPGKTTQQYGDNFGTSLGFGNTFFDIIPVYVVLVVLLISEVRDVAYYLFSNWAKVDLICRYLRRTYSPTMTGIYMPFVVNKCRLKSQSWINKMSQCSILGHRPWWKPDPNSNCWRVRGLPLWRLIGFHEEESTMELIAVKKSIFRKLKSLTVCQGNVKHIQTPSPPVTFQGALDAGFLACGCKSVADTILAWHIATSLFELKDLEQQDPERSMENPPSQSLDPDNEQLDPERGTGEVPQLSDSDNKIVATRLSRYCTYLVACRPELLPDEDEWCKVLYADVLKHADQVLLVDGVGAGFQQLVEKLTAATDKYNVLKIGAMLAQQLVPSNGWGQLAEFWSEMILYIAPSENLDGHSEAIARGGEMVTLLWALLAHVGILGRLDDTVTTTNTAAGETSKTMAEDAPDAAVDDAFNISAEDGPNVLSEALNTSAKDAPSASVGDALSMQIEDAPGVTGDGALNMSAEDAPVATGEASNTTAEDAPDVAGDGALNMSTEGTGPNAVGEALNMSAEDTTSALGDALSTSSENASDATGDNTLNISAEDALIAAGGESLNMTVEDAPDGASEDLVTSVEDAPDTTGEASNTFEEDAPNAAGEAFNTSIEDAPNNVGDNSLNKSA